MAHLKVTVYSVGEVYPGTLPNSLVYSVDDVYMGPILGSLTRNADDNLFVYEITNNDFNGSSLTYFTLHMDPDVTLRAGSDSPFVTSINPSDVAESIGFNLNLPINNSAVVYIASPGMPGFGSSNIEGWYPGRVEDPGVYVPLSAPNPVPEPSTLLMIGSGMIGLAGIRRRIRQNKK